MRQREEEWGPVFEGLGMETAVLSGETNVDIKAIEKVRALIRAGVPLSLSLSLSLFPTIYTHSVPMFTIQSDLIFASAKNWDNLSRRWRQRKNIQNLGTGVFFLFLLLFIIVFFNI